MNEMTKREETIYLLGMFGQQLNNFDTAQLLLDDNKLSDVFELYYKLSFYNDDFNNCSFISVAGNYPKIKLKDGNFSKVSEIVEESKVKIVIE